jgi:chromosome segregation ATPase
MSYTPKELTEKYENLWEQVDGVYKELSSLKECIGEIEAKYDTIWGKMSTLTELNKSIDSKYDLIWGKCNTNAAEIIKLKEYNINSGTGQISSIKHDITLIQSKLRTLDKMEETYTARLSDIRYDMHSTNIDNHRMKDYVDDKFGNLCVVLQIIICIIVIICLYLMYILK